MTVYEQIELAAQRAYTRGVQTGNGGNLSARKSENEMIIKSSGGSYIDCKKTGENLVETDLDGKALAGQTRKPSREAYLHGELYKLNPNFGGIVHAHSAWCIAWAEDHDVLPCIAHHVRLKIGGDIPVIPVPTMSVGEKDIWMVREVFEKNPDLKAFILLKHGLFAMGKDIIDAEHNAELVEEAAKTAVLAELLKK